MKRNTKVAPDVCAKLSATVLLLPSMAWTGSTVLHIPGSKPFSVCECSLSPDGLGEDTYPVITAHDH
jgi:hypothetical protein